MDTGYAMLLQIAYLVDGIVDSGLTHIVFIFSVGSDDGRQVLTNERSGEGDRGSELIG